MTYFVTHARSISQTQSNNTRRAQKPLVIANYKVGLRTQSILRPSEEQKTLLQHPDYNFISSLTHKKDLAVGDKKLLVTKF